MTGACFWCEGLTSYHPTCSAPGCSADVHGHGPEGKRVFAYCPEHRGVTLAADGKGGA